MKKYLIKLGVFIGVVLFGNTLIFLSSIPKLKNECYILSPSRNILIAGDSRTERAINDSIFERSVNISQSAELYLYTYIKIKNILANNPHIDTILLSYSYRSLTKLTDKWFEDSALIANRMPSYLPMMGYGELSDVFKKNPTGFLIAIAHTYKEYVNRFIKRRSVSKFSDLDIGGYNFIVGDINNSTVDSIKNFDEKLKSVSNEQFRYLKKIHTLCQELNIELILIKTPLHKSDVNKYNSSKELENCKNQLKKISVLDYTNFALPDSCFWDATHLNYKGARVFSFFLKEMDKN